MVGTCKWVETVLFLTMCWSLHSTFGKEMGCQSQSWTSDCAVLCLSFQTWVKENYGAILVLNLSQMYWWGCTMMERLLLLRKSTPHFPSVSR